MNYIKGTFKKSIYEGSSNYKIGLFKVKETNISNWNKTSKTITFTGFFGDLIVENDYVFEGELTFHDKYGEQFKVCDYKPVELKTTDNIIEFLSSSCISGCGIKSAIKIVEYFGEDTIDVIKNNYECLTKVKGINKLSAQKIHESFMKYSDSQNDIVYLKELGFNLSESILLNKEYGNRIMSIIKHNIYSLIDFVSFNKLDAIYLKNNDINSELRIKAVIIELLKDISNIKGDTLVEIEKIYKILYKYNLDIGINELELYLQMLIDENKIVYKNNLYSLKVFFDKECYIASILYSINKKGEDLLISEDISEFEKRNGIIFQSEQKKAIITSLSNNMAIITGGPGTGKTTIIKAIVHLYSDIFKLDKEKETETIALLAPTGRASKRLAEEALCKAETIHRFLKWNKETDTFQVNEENPAPHKLIIIDEASMIDVNLFYSLLKGLRHDIKMIIVGDEFQLPSVGAGNILNDLIASNKFCHVLLTKIYRQGDSSSIPYLAKDIKEHCLDNILINKNDYHFINIDEINCHDVIKHTCLKFLKNNIKEDELQVLVPMYRGINGIDKINSILRDIYNPCINQKEVTYGEITYREGDKVLQLINDANNKIFNGDIGYIKRISKDIKQKDIILIDFNGIMVEYNKSDLKNIKHGYAISVHKSQGSEFNYVFILVFPQYNNLLYNKLVYTAVSRAKKELFIIGNYQAMKKAILNDYSLNRQTNLIHILNKTG